MYDISKYILLSFMLRIHMQLIAYLLAYSFHESHSRLILDDVDF